LRYNLKSSGEVGELNEILPAGEHNVSFDATTLPSGIYIAKLSADNYNESIKMTLLK
jgi:hypothetical protein